MKFRCSWQNVCGFDEQAEKEGPRSLFFDETPFWLRTPVFFFYQPIVSLETGRICSVEALVRSGDRNDKPVVPASLLNRLYYCEREKIVDFDKFVLAKNLEFLAFIHESGLKIRISINVSGVLFLEKYGDPLSFIKAKLLQLGAPELIQFVDLEIVEWMEFEITELVMERTQACRDAGIGVCLDDAGTGSVGLDTFVSLPFTCLKIDRVFVQKMPIEEKAFYIVKGFTETAKSLNIRVVAEGVETAQQVKILREIGVEFAQGYYFYRPMSGDELLSKRQFKM